MRVLWVSVGEEGILERWWLDGDDCYLLLSLRSTKEHQGKILVCMFYY